MKGHPRQRAGCPAYYWELEVNAGRDPVTKTWCCAEGNDLVRALTELVLQSG